VDFHPQRKGTFPSSSRRLCQILSKSVKNCNRESARTHTQKCVGHWTPDIGH